MQNRPYNLDSHDEMNLDQFFDVLNRHDEVEDKIKAVAMPIFEAESALQADMQAEMNKQLEGKDMLEAIEFMVNGRDQIMAKFEDRMAAIQEQKQAFIAANADLVAEDKKMHHALSDHSETAADQLAAELEKPVVKTQGPEVHALSEERKAKVASELAKVRFFKSAVASDSDTEIVSSLEVTPVNSPKMREMRK